MVVPSDSLGKRTKKPDPRVRGAHSDLAAVATVANWNTWPDFYRLSTIKGLTADDRRWWIAPGGFM